MKKKPTPELTGQTGLAAPFGYGTYEAKFASDLTQKKDPRLKAFEYLAARISELVTQIDFSLRNDSDDYSFDVEHLRAPLFIAMHPTILQTSNRPPTTIKPPIEEALQLLLNRIDAPSFRDKHKELQLLLNDALELPGFLDWVNSNGRTVTGEQPLPPVRSR